MQDGQPSALANLLCSLSSVTDETDVAVAHTICLLCVWPWFQRTRCFGGKATQSDFGGVKLLSLLTTFRPTWFSSSLAQIQTDTWMLKRLNKPPFSITKKKSSTRKSGHRGAPRSVLTRAGACFTRFFEICSVNKDTTGPFPPAKTQSASHRSASKQDYVDRVTRPFSITPLST